MPPRTRISIAKPDIVKFFDSLPSPILRRKEIGRILSAHRQEWRLTQSMRLDAFLDYLVKNAPLERVDLPLPYRPETLYTWREVSVHQIALGVKAGSYLTHYTAMAMHALTTQVPKTIYVNVEQRPQRLTPEPLAQVRIDQAFRRPHQRMTNNVADFGKFRLTYINGKYTNQLGVIDFEPLEGERLRVTGIERTLIDIAVRPAYSGGVGEVAAAYAAAKPSISVNRLAALLEQLDYVYPYHQVIGYYLERAGYKDSLLKLFERKPIEFDFYLTYGMPETDYSSRWRLFIPKGF
jgi:predicted transcriptional regulator of viral defense system